MTVTDEQIRQRIAEIEREREAYVRQAEIQIAAYGGAVQALEQLLQASEAEASNPTEPGE